MRPLTLHLSNFGSFRGEHDLDLSGISCAVLVGPNGAGKSTIIDAMVFALFGQARGATLDSVISDGEDLARVELRFARGEDTGVVSRQVKRGRGCTHLHFEVLGVSRDGKRIGDTQQAIEQYLGMTAETFAATACMGQNDWGAFIFDKPADRKTFLGKVLGLRFDLWDQRAETARTMLRDLNARMNGLRERHLALTEAAGQADVRRQFGENEATQAALALEITALEKALAALQEGKVQLLTDRQADAAKRKALDDLAERLTVLEKQITAAQGRLADLDKATAGNPEVVAEISKAEAAQTEAQELEARRQERERIEAQARTLAEKIIAAKQGHAGAIHLLEAEIKRLRDSHGSQIYALEIESGAKRGQAEVLDTVPCAATRDSLLVDNCPLIAQAREAREVLPRIERQIAELRGQIPWADDEKRLAELQAQTPAADLIEQKAKLKVTFEGISYDADAHAALRQAAGRLDSLREALAKATAAEAARAEVLTGLEKSRRERVTLDEQRATLDAELGLARDWTSAIADIGKQISMVTDKQAEARRRESALTTDRGGLAEKLRIAEQAGKDAEALVLEIAEAERRAKLLSILVEAFGKKGIPAMLVDQAASEIETAANDMLRTLSGGRMSLSLRTQRENADGALAEVMDLVVCDDLGERDCSKLSGGEKTRVALALRCGFSKALARRAGAQCEALILDEPPGLDERGWGELVEYLVKLQEYFPLILVITHVDQLRDMLPCRIEVSKDADGSHAEVISG